MIPQAFYRPAVRSAPVLRARFEVSNLLSLLLAVAFLGTGIARVGATRFVIETFQGSGLPAWSLVTLGVVEIFAAVLTLIPTTRLPGTALIAAIMSGAIGYHVVRGEELLLLVPATALLAAVACFTLELSLRRFEFAHAPSAGEP